MQEKVAQDRCVLAYSTHECIIYLELILVL